MEISVLLAEDQNPGLYEMLLQAANGFKFTTVKRGDHAVRLARQNQYDIILMDVRLPEMDGIKAIKAIRKFDPRTPIVAFTAYDDRDTRQRVLAAGANAYFVKPPDYTKMVVKFVELLAEASRNGPDEVRQKQRRLQLLKLQRAMYGISSPPELIMEIEDLEAELGEV